ncbi:phage major capsid protein [Escherichia coli]|nr:phage major capsid protein [Escherichia coli]
MKLSYKLVIAAFFFTVIGSFIWSANHYYSKYQHEKKRADEAVQNAKSATVITNNVLQSLQIVNTVLEANYLWRPGLELGQPSSLAGYGIAENEQMPDIAADAKAIAFGNFKRGYTIVDRIGTRILRDPYTNKPFVGFYTTKRTGGMLVDSQAIKLLKIAAA